jgi:hypothetical protein
MDSRMRIKTITDSDLRQKPCQFHWYGLLQIPIVVRLALTVNKMRPCRKENPLRRELRGKLNITQKW